MTVRLLGGYNAVGKWLSPSGSSINWIVGKTQREILTGTFENDAIYSSGAATASGGDGDDIYYFWNSDDLAVETSSGGIDTVVSQTLTFRLTAWVENLAIEADGAGGTGNALDNIISGGDGGQMIDGAAGNDILTGGAGTDLFLLQHGTGRDVITDFQPGIDKLVIGGAFTQFGSFAQVKAAMRQVGADTVLDLSADDAVVLSNTALSSLTANDVRLPESALTGLRLTFSDDFTSFAANGTGIAADGSAIWRSSFLWGLRSNAGSNEVQYYGDASAGVNPFTLRDTTGAGILDITARQASGLPEGATWSSGLLITSSSLVQTYGLFEIRAKIAEGSGFWPAFWLGRADLIWPAEIDVFEVLGNRPGQLYSTVHSGATAGGHQEDQRAYWAAQDLSKNFHTYAVSWRPDFITFYLDGTELHRVATPADLHAPMYMLTNLAVGGAGSWAGPAANGSSATMSVDWIRASQFADLVGPLRPSYVTAAVLDGAGSGERLIGGAGMDHIHGGRGNDTLTGGDDSDCFVFLRGDGRDVVTDFRPGLDKLLLEGETTSSISTKVSNGNLVIAYGSSNTVTLQKVTALSPGDLLFGDNSITGSSGNDWINRSSSVRVQTLAGGKGDDKILGGAGSDWIDGGQGLDVLTGNGGADNFVFRTWDRQDTITDFVSGLDRMLLVGVQRATVWINPAHDVAGREGLEISYGTAGDAIFLPGVQALAAGDIVFA